MITNKDISIDKGGSIILNGDKYPLASQAEVDAVKDDIDDIGDTIGDITQTGITGASVAAQLEALDDLISGLSTATQIWEGYATEAGTIFDLTQNYTDFKYLLVLAKTNVEQKTMLIPTSIISDSVVWSDVLSSGTWDTTKNAFGYNSMYGIKFTAVNKFKLEELSYNNSNWVLRPLRIYGIG